MRDWFCIKKTDKLFYKKLQSEELTGKCYYTTYLLANILKNPDIKILWICIETYNKKCGHAVIARKNNIYDSNLKRTYNREYYLRAYNAQIFKEYSINEYLNKENLYFDKFLDWEEFGKWCDEKNATRNK